MRGVNVGRVMAFNMAPNQGVRITLEIEGAWKIPADSRSRLVSGGILGGRTVEIVEGSSSQAISGGGEIPGENVAGLLDFPADLGQDAQAVLVQIKELLAQPTLDAIQGSAQELQALLVQLSRLADDQGREIAQLTASLNRSALGLEAASGSGEDLASAVARADSALLTVNRTSEVVLRASLSLQSILDRMDSGEGTLGQLSINPALYENLTAALESVRLLTDDIRENPGRYVKIEIF
jgi:phospholipid/cholesterol/gamma-HCH transport system substrate-binding protein